MRSLVVLAICVSLTGSAVAVEDADRTAVQGVIEQQLSAFLKDDAAGAYSFAAPSIQALYPSSDGFLGMVKRAFPPVYRPRSHSFGEAKDAGAGIEQSVDILDAAGDGWTALYSLVKQPDGSWKITGCRLVKKQGVSV